MGNCSYNCWRFSLHSVCPNLWQKAQTFNRVLPLHLWLMKTKKTHMTHACCWFSRHLPNCGPLTSLNTETTLWKIYSVGISQVGIAVMGGKLYGLDLTAAKQVQSKGQKMRKNMSHSDVNWPLTDFSYQYLRRLIILSRGRIFTSQDSPKNFWWLQIAILWLQDFSIQKTHQARKDTPKHEDFVEFFAANIKAPASLNQQNAFQASKKNRRGHSFQLFSMQFHAVVSQFSEFSRWWFKFFMVPCDLISYASKMHESKSWGTA